MKTLREYVNNILWGNEPMIVEMATLGRPTFNNARYHIAIHGTLAGDRETPHIHIYLNDDVRPYNKFNFEVSIVDVLCKDEINLIKMRDEKRNVRHNNRRQCSWAGYYKLRNDFEDWLFGKPTSPGNFKDNLEACVYWYNHEGDPKSDNAVRDYINSHGLTVLQKYKEYI